MIRNEWKRCETSKDTQKHPQESKPTHITQESKKGVWLFLELKITKQNKNTFFSETAKKQLPC
jgi:hypothetical protein